MNEEKLIFGLGAKKDEKDKRDYRAMGIVPTIEVPKQIFSLPETYPPKNQFSRGSCTSQAQTHHKERQEDGKRSARFVMALTKQMEGNTDYGAYTRNTFKIVNEYGSCSEDLYPEPEPAMTWEEYIDVKNIPQTCYDEAKNHKSQSYWRVENILNEIKSLMIQKKNSIVCSMAWFSEFNDPVNGILSTNYANDAGGHAVELKGWDDFKEQLIFKNSWGKSWGNNGFFYMPFSIFNVVVWDLWCSLDIPSVQPVDNYYDGKRTWDGYLREKGFAFNPWILKKLGRLPNNREIKALAYGFWSYDSIFTGKVSDVWLKITKPQAIKNNVIDKNENLIK